MVLLPTLKLIALLALPEVTVVPFTFTVAVLSLTVGVTVIDATVFATEAVYEVVALANVGDRVPLESPKLDKSAFADAARVTVTVYVFVVLLSCALTTVVMVLMPTFKLIVLAAPDVAGAPFTVMVALAWFLVGVSVMDETELATDAV
jgi:hypothetical protein